MSTRYIKPEVLRKIKNSRFVHIVTIGTKPDIIKQAPIYHELKRRGQAVIICHSEQHYDYNYSGGVEEEFGLHVDIRLGISGSWPEKTVQMIERFSAVITAIKKAGPTPIPYIHGDTSTASAIAFAAMLHKVSCVHVEAGIRTMTPKGKIYQKHLKALRRGKFSWKDYYRDTKNIKNYSLGSIEPFPEQMNTRIAEPPSGFCAAPVKLNALQLLREGVEPSKIAITGNTIADAITKSVKAAKHSDVFRRYPTLAKNDFIMMSVHRRENIYNRKRFTAIMGAMEMLLKNNYTVLFLSLLSMEDAIDKHNYRKKVNKLIKTYPKTLIFSKAWAFHKDVMAAMQRSAVVVSDSGGFQEEANYLRIPSVTVRFGSDRSETFFAGANIPAPPINEEFIYEVIKGAFKNKAMKRPGNLYGKNVAKKIIDGVLKHMHWERGLFLSEEARLKI